MKHTVTIYVDDKLEKTIGAETGELLLNVLVRGEVAIAAPCGGNGKCGKCLVRVTGNIVSNESGYCLACKTRIEGDCAVHIDEVKAKVLTDGVDRALKTDGIKGTGLAIDIGTTTVAGFIVDLESGKTIDTVSMLNPQRAHGADVISRLEYAETSEENSRTLKNEIDSMIAAFIQKGNRKIDKCVLVGNTAMMHLAGGYTVQGIAKAPFNPYYMSSHIRNNAGVETFFGGVVSGYVGADTVAAMLACEMDNIEETTLLIDIGTNGEIVLKHKGRFVCCSCAAGPAFEGAHISCGTGAIPGAVDHLKADGDSFVYSTVDGQKACGICGSGLVDTVAYLVENEIVSETGRMADRFVIADGVYVTAEDIREVQLAKAAIAAGIQILMNELEVKEKDITKVYLAGGFGSFIDVTNACKIGLLPSKLSEKITTVGNAAGTGARMLLVSNNARIRYERLRNACEYVELAAQDDFEDEFADNLLFETIS